MKTARPEFDMDGPLSFLAIPSMHRHSVTFTENALGEPYPYSNKEIDPPVYFFAAA